MNIAAQFLQALFLPNTKMLFLIDNQKPKIVEFYRFCQQRMRTYDDLDIACLKSGANLFGLCRRCHS